VIVIALQWCELLVYLKYKYYSDYFVCMLGREETKHVRALAVLENARISANLKLRWKSRDGLS